MEQTSFITNDNGALQKPVGSGFSATSTTDEVIKGIDLSGKVAIVTGGYAGLGLETTKILANAGATVIVPARDNAKAAKNLEGIPNVETAVMDLMDPASIEAFAKTFLASGRPLHLLINNAGIMWTPLQRDSRGYESQFSTNHLGHFQLTAALWEVLKNAGGARVVNVSSWGHHFSPVLFDDPHFNQHNYESLVGYGQSKTANILFSLELDKRAQEYGVRSYSLHPGAIFDTDLKRHMTQEQLVMTGILDAHGNPIPDADKKFKTIPQGAATQVWCATNPMLENIGGVYCENVEVAIIDERNPGLDGYAKTGKLSAGVLPYAVDPGNAVRLWALSEQLTSITFL